MTKESRVFLVYKAFNQEGGTIHQLVDILIPKDRICESSFRGAIEAYLFDIMDTENPGLFIQKLEGLESRIKIINLVSR